MAANRLHKFLHPQSIAIVGASEQGLYTAGILGDLVRYGYGGRLYPVNPKRETVRGLPCFPSLRDLPERPDLVIIVVGRERVLGIIDECIANGVPAALIITAGFGESDATGKALEAQLKERLRGGSLAVIGPNCAGFANVAGRIVATRLPAPPVAGSLGFVSASGALMMAMQGVFADLHMGTSHLISLGNQADVSLTEAIAYLVEDDATQIIAAFIEGIDNGPRFRAAALGAQRVGKPLVVVKSGRTTAGQRAAATHTAALAGSDAVFQVVCREAGVILVEDVAELTRTLRLFAAWEGRLPQGSRLALVTQSGGMGSLTADLATTHGFELPELPAQLQSQLHSLPHLLTFEAYGNPADVRGAGTVGNNAATTLSLFLDAPGFDSVVLLLAKSAVDAREIETAQALAELASRSRRPFCVVWVGQRHSLEGTERARSLELLAEAGVPVFEQPGDCLRALRHVSDFAAAQKNKATFSRRLPGADFATRTDVIPDAAPRWLSYREMEALLGSAGIPLMPAMMAGSPEEAVACAGALGYPVAAKLLAAAQTHKSDAGLVRLYLGNEEELRVAAGELWERVSGGEAEGILIQKMAASGVEVLIGVENDAQFGPVLACGAGGVLVELLGEVALRLPPLEREGAMAMINETRLARLLAGFRGRPAADANALAELLVRVAQLVLAKGDQLVSLDMNPVFVHDVGLSIVDVRVQWRGQTSTPLAKEPMPAFVVTNEVQE